MQQLAHWSHGKVVFDGKKGIAFKVNSLPINFPLRRVERWTRVWKAVAVVADGRKMATSERSTEASIPTKHANYSDYLADRWLQFLITVADAMRRDKFAINSVDRCSSSVTVLTSVSHQSAMLNFWCNILRLNVMNALGLSSVNCEHT